MFNDVKFTFEFFYEISFLMLQRGSNNRNLIIDIIFAMNFFSGDLFRAAPYSHMSVPLVTREKICLKKSMAKNCIIISKTGITKMSRTH